MNADDVKVSEIHTHTHPQLIILFPVTEAHNNFKEIRRQNSQQQTILRKTRERCTAKTHAALLHAVQKDHSQQVQGPEGGEGVGGLLPALLHPLSGAQWAVHDPL